MIRAIEALLARVVVEIAEYWPNPVRARDDRIGAVPGTRDYDCGYAMEQLNQRVRNGLRVAANMPTLIGKYVLEIGCGHGGLACFLAGGGARKVVGVDVNEKHLDIARTFSETLGLNADRCHFELGDAHALPFAEGEFDLVVANNLFEHVTTPAQVLREAYRVLRPGGTLVVPSFSSIYSKYGLHLKHGLKLPWLNLILPERVIVDALRRRVERHPHLVDVYPGVSAQATRVRDVRRHRDLNDITHAGFLNAAREVGFKLQSFHVHATLVGYVVRRLVPVLERTALLDVFSTGAGAVLSKADAPQLSN